MDPRPVSGSGKGNEVRYAIVAMLLAVAGAGAWGQQICSKTPDDNCTTLSGTVTPGLIHTIPIKPPDKPCDMKYEYSAVTADHEGYKETCFPLMHTVTEREWQDLKEHVRTLERMICVNGSGVLMKCKVTGAPTHAK